MRSRDGCHVERAVVEALAQQAVYLLWKVEAAERYQAAMEQVIEFCGNPPNGNKDALVATVRVFLRQTMQDVKRDRPDYKVAVERIRAVIEEATGE